MREPFERFERHGSAPPEYQPDLQPRAEQSFWAWFAIGVLMFCWIAEATLCAERGF